MSWTRRARTAWFTTFAVLVVGLSVGASTASARSTSTKTTARALAAAGNPIAEALLKEAGKGILSKGAGAGVSFALTAMGIGGDAETAAALAEIKAQLVRVNEQLTTLRTESKAILDAVSEASFSAAAREALPIIDNIELAEKKLAQAASQPAGTKQQQKAAEDAAQFIKANVVDKASLLSKLAFGSGVIAPTSIYAAAIKVRTNDSFLSHQDSVELRYLVDTYTAYEAAAIQLEVTYRMSEDGYPRQLLADLVDEWTAKVTKELALRRDAVPEHTVIDARTGLMWWTKFYGVTTHPKLIETDFFASLFFVGVKAQSGLEGWRMPSKDEMVGLIKGWNSSPAEWLSSNGGFASTDGVGENPAFWTGTGSELPKAINGVQQWSFWYVRLSDGLVDTLPTTYQQKHGYMAVRTPAEKYVPGT